MEITKRERLRHALIWLKKRYPALTEQMIDQTMLSVPDDAITDNIVSPDSDEYDNARIAARLLEQYGPCPTMLPRGLREFGGIMS